MTLTLKGWNLLIFEEDRLPSSKVCGGVAALLVENIPHLSGSGPGRFGISCGRLGRKQRLRRGAGLYYGLKLVLSVSPREVVAFS